MWPNPRNTAITAPSDTSDTDWYKYPHTTPQDEQVHIASSAVKDRSAPLSTSSLRNAQRRLSAPFAPPPPSASSGLGVQTLKTGNVPMYSYPALPNPSTSSLSSAGNSIGYGRGSGSSRTSFSSLSANSDFGSVRSERVSWNKDRRADVPIGDSPEGRSSSQKHTERDTHAVRPKASSTESRKASLSTPAHPLGSAFLQRGAPLALPSKAQRRASDSPDLHNQPKSTSVHRPRPKGRSVSDLTGIQPVIELQESRAAHRRSDYSVRQAQSDASPANSTLFASSEGSEYSAPLQLLTPQLEGAIKSLQRRDGEAEILAALTSHLSEEDDAQERHPIGRTSAATLSAVREAMATTRKGLQRLASRENINVADSSARVRRGLNARSASVDHVLQCADGHSLSIRLPQGIDLQAAHDKDVSVPASPKETVASPRTSRQVSTSELEDVEYLVPDQSKPPRLNRRRQSLPHLHLLNSESIRWQMHGKALEEQKRSISSIAETPPLSPGARLPGDDRDGGSYDVLPDRKASVSSAPATRSTFDARPSTLVLPDKDQQDLQGATRSTDLPQPPTPASAPASVRASRRSSVISNHKSRRGTSTEATLPKSLSGKRSTLSSTLPNNRSRTLAKRSFSALRGLLSPSLPSTPAKDWPSPTARSTGNGSQAAADASGHASGPSGGGGFRGGPQGTSGGWGGGQSGGGSFSSGGNNPGGGSAGGGGSGGGGGQPKFSPTDSRSDPPVQSLFRRLELVGRGAYGAVYRGVHVATGSVVALKVVNLDTPDDDVTGIQSEVALLSQLRDADQRNVVRYWGCWMKGPEIWIVMDFAEGGSIRTIMKSGLIPEKYIVLIVRETLVALQYLHRSAIIHRDVKAANILLTNAGRILLCDFGVAASLASSSTHAKRTTFVGTPYWMAPEVITKGKAYDQRADIWSLGITIYEIATGNPPLADQDQMRVIMLIPKSKPPRLPADGDFSPGLRDFVALCLNEEPNERPTAEDLAKNKWIKASAKTPNSILRELIAQYVAWTKSGGMRMSLLGAEAADLGESGNRDSFAFDAQEDHEDWEFGTVRNRVDSHLYEGFDGDANASSGTTSAPQRDHPLLRLFAQGMSEEDLIGGHGFRGAGISLREAPPVPPTASFAPITSTVRPGAYVADRVAPAAPLASTAGPQGAPTSAGSFAGSGSTPFRFGGGGGGGNASSSATTSRPERPPPITIPAHPQTVPESPYLNSAVSSSMASSTSSRQAPTPGGSRRQRSVDSIAQRPGDSLSTEIQRGGPTDYTGGSMVSADASSFSSTSTAPTSTETSINRSYPHQRSGSRSLVHRRDHSNVSNLSSSHSPAGTSPASDSAVGRYGASLNGVGTGHVPHARKGSRNAMIVPANWQSGDLGSDLERDHKTGMERAATSAGELDMPSLGPFIAPSLDRAMSDQSYPAAPRGDTSSTAAAAQPPLPSSLQGRPMPSRTATQPTASTARGMGTNKATDVQGHQPRSVSAMQARLGTANAPGPGGEDFLPPSPLVRTGPTTTWATGPDSLAENTASSNTVLTASSVANGPPLRPLDLSLLGAKEDVYHELARTVDELGKWLDVVGGGLGKVTGPSAFGSGIGRAD